MKASVRAARRIFSQTKKRTRAHSTLMYRTYKEVSPASVRSPDFLVSRRRFPRAVLLRLVSSEASRLSRANRGKVITVQEIDAAVSLVRRRICTRAAA